MKKINEVFYVRKDPDDICFEVDTQFGYTDLARIADRYETEEEAREYMEPGEFTICRVTVEYEELPN